MSDPSSFWPITVLLGIEGICSQSFISSLVLCVSDFSGEMFDVCAGDTILKNKRHNQTWYKIGVSAATRARRGTLTCFSREIWHGRGHVYFIGFYLNWFRHIQKLEFPNGHCTLYINRDAKKKKEPTNKRLERKQVHYCAVLCWKKSNGADSQLFVGFSFDSIFCRDTPKKRVSLKQIKMEQIIY
jgi:hypothetical protein